MFRTGPEGLGLLLSAVGVGGVLGGMVAVRTARVDRIGLTQVIATLVFAGALIGFALAKHMGVAMFFLVIAGMAEMVNMSSNHTALQMSAPLSMRGRVASLLPMFPAMMAVGALTYGRLCRLAGRARRGDPAGGAGCSCCRAASWMGSAALRGLRLSKLVERH